METKALLQLVMDALEDMKALDIRVLDVREKSNITDIMVVASGTSARHVRSLGGSLALTAKKAGVPPLGVEGEKEGEWVLVDLIDVVVHLMLPSIREFYGLEKLWTVEGEMEAQVEE